LNGVVVLCNKSAQQIVGLTKKQIVGKSISDKIWSLICEDKTPFLNENHPVTITLKTGKSLSNITMGVNRSRSELKWILMNSTPLYDNSKHINGVLVTFSDITNYKKNEFSRYYKMVKYSGFWPDATKAWDWLNNETIGNNIAYTGRAVPFPLYGSGLKNNVYYVSVNRTQPAKLHYFNNSKYEYGLGFESLLKSIEEEYNYRGNADYNIWLSNLVKARTDYLFVYSLQQTKNTIFPLEDNWAKLNTDKFDLLFSNNTIHIYRVVK